MLGLLDEIDRTIILVRILSEEYGGHWGYSPPGLRHRSESLVFHVDSDDTAYVIRTLQRLGVNRPPDCLMAFYREPERLFATFNAEASRPVLTTTASPSHNFDAHPDVNANVFLALRDTHLDHLINYDMLRDAQDKRGYWRSYFYPSLLFTTLLVVDLLRRDVRFADETTRAIAFVRDSQNDDGSWGDPSDPYETALAVSTLAASPECASATQRGVQYLISAMADDGSWASPACIWEFHADADNVLMAYDAHRAYVTARCTTALRRATGQIRG